MTEKEIKQLLRKYLNGTISKYEEKLLEEFDSKLIAKNTAVSDNHEVKQRAKARLLHTIAQGNRKKDFQNGLKIAASLLLLVGMGYLVTLLNQPSPDPIPVKIIEKSTAWGQKMNLELPDGTKVKLNTGSTISFPETFAKNTREVVLSGEAFFEVAENVQKPFVITSGNVKTTVLGTSFNVNSYSHEEEVAVTVVTGKVKIASHGNELFLNPDEQGVYNKSSNGISKMGLDAKDFLKWKDGIIYFDDATLSEVATTLERWYGVTVVFGNEHIKSCNLTASFKNELLSAVLEGIVFAKKGLHYEYKTDQTIILSGRCN